MPILQESTRKATLSPIFQPELAEIRAKLTEWDQRFGSTKVSQWLFDVAFHRLYQANGFESANKLLTKTRYALKRAERTNSVAWPPRCIGDRQPEAWKKRFKQPKRPQMEAA